MLRERRKQHGAIPGSTDSHQLRCCFKSFDRRPPFKEKESHMIFVADRPTRPIKAVCAKYNLPACLYVCATDAAPASRVLRNSFRRFRVLSGAYKSSSVVRPPSLGYVAVRPPNSILLPASDFFSSRKTSS